MSILKYIKGRYLVIKGRRGSGRSQAEAIQTARAVLAAEQVKPQPREYIERIQANLGPCVTLTNYKWYSVTGEVIGWYTEEELRGLRARIAAAAELPLAPGVADEILRVVAMIDDALGDNNEKGGAQA